MYSIILDQSTFTHKDHLKYPFEERGLQFGDGVYEVVRIYQGKYYLFKEHIDRLYRSAEAIKLELPFQKEEFSKLLEELLERNKVTSDASLYLQATRGTAPRNHVFPKEAIPNVYAYITKVPRKVNTLQSGVHTITQRDARWENCYIKSLNLLPNVLAKQAAAEQDCYEAILHKDGIVTECSASNVYIVKDGSIYTHPATRNILHGCVRMAVERFSKDLNIPFIEDSFTLEELYEADEVFLTSSTSEVTPIVQVDDKQINDGKPGKITRMLQHAYENDANIVENKVGQI